MAILCLFLGLDLPISATASLDADKSITPNATKMLSAVASGPATWVFIGDSITYGTGATSFSTSWSYQVVGQIQKLGNFYTGAGFCSTEGSASCVGSSTGTWMALQGAGPSQTVAPAFSQTKTGTAGSTWKVGPYTGTIVDIVYYTNAATTVSACAISIDGGAATTVGGATANVTPHIFTASGLSNFAVHKVAVTSDGTCNLYGVNFRNSSGLAIWNTASGGATSAAFATPGQLSWLALVPNLAGIVIELGQNDPAAMDQAQSVANIQAIVSMNQSLANPVPIFFLYPEAPKSDVGQGALYSAIQSNIAAPGGYDALSIYDSWGADSYVAMPKLYVGGADIVHPSQAGHDAIANAVLNFFGVPAAADDNTSTILAYGSVLAGKDSFGNTVSIAGVTNGNQVTLGGAYVSQVNIGTGGPSGPAALQVLNNGHIGIAPTSASPTLSNCGMGASISGNDVKGEVTEGMGAKGCQINFGTAYSPAAACVVSAQSGSIKYSVSTKAISITSSASAKIDYICFQ